MNEKLDEFTENSPHIANRSDTQDLLDTLTGASYVKHLDKDLEVLRDAIEREVYGEGGRAMKKERQIGIRVGLPVFFALELEDVYKHAPGSHRNLPPGFLRLPHGPVFA
jgi:hypothetical protein